MQFSSFVILTMALCLVKVMGQLENNYSLYKMLAQSDDYIQDTHARSMNCFDYYMSAMQGISERFEASSRLCTDSAKSAYENAEKDSLVHQQALTEVVTNSCNSLNTCESKESGSEAFDCYVSKSYTNAKDFYKLSSDATTHLDDMKSEFRRIDRQQQSCFSKAQRQFNEESDEAMDDLSKCLKQSSPYPAPSPSAAAPLRHKSVLKVLY